MKGFYLPVILVILFISESIFTDLFPSELFSIERIFVPHFLFCVIIFISIYVNQKYGMIYGAIFGLLFDIVYTEIIGVYMFSYALLAYLVAKAIKVVHSNILVSSILTLLAIAVLEFFVYGVNILIGNAQSVNLQVFLYNRLFPTLVLNSVFVILLSYPLKRSLQKIAPKLEE